MADRAVVLWPMLIWPVVAVLMFVLQASLFPALVAGPVAVLIQFALLLGAEIFLDLAYLGSLKVANFGRDLVQSTGNHGERCQISRMAVTLDDLRGYGGPAQS